MLKQLAEIAFFTDQVEQLVVFYQALLDRAPVVQAEGMAIFEVGQTRLFIHKRYPAAEGELPPENHLAFAVEGVDNYCRRLQQQGLTLEVEPQNYYWGRSAYLRDPGGQLIELIEAKPAT
jgi:catechol 2,3-dioxygenase-like lactoylglutathione lyase family enzyme